MQLGEFAALRVSPDTTLDFVDSKDDLRQHYDAFLVTEREFDEVFDRIRERALSFSACVSGASGRARPDGSW